MKISLAAISLFLFGISVVFLLLLTLFEASLSSMSLETEKAISTLLLVLPGILGAVLGIVSLIRKEGKSWMAILGILLNAIFVSFQIFVISFSG